MKVTAKNNEGRACRNTFDHRLDYHGVITQWISSVICFDFHYFAPAVDV